MSPQLLDRMQRWLHSAKKIDFSSSKFGQEEEVEHQVVVASTMLADEDLNKEVVEVGVELSQHHQLFKKIASRILVTATFMASGSITL